MPNIELTTQVMIQNPATGEVLVQDRLLSWKGLAFPGGHVDRGESIYGCAVREIREETGLTIANLQSCGMIHWHNIETGDRYFVFLYKTSDYAGELIPEMEEGRHFWMTPEALAERVQYNTENSFAKYMPMFFGGHGYSEGYGGWSRPEDKEMVYF